MRISRCSSVLRKLEQWRYIPIGDKIFRICLTVLQHQGASDRQTKRYMSECRTRDENRALLPKSYCVLKTVQHSTWTGLWAILGYGILIGIVLHYNAWKLCSSYYFHSRARFEKSIKVVRCANVSATIQVIDNDHSNFFECCLLGSCSTDTVYLPAQDSRDVFICPSAAGCSDSVHALLHSSNCTNNQQYQEVRTGSVATHALGITLSATQLQAQTRGAQTSASAQQGTRCTCLITIHWL